MAAFPDSVDATIMNPGAMICGNVWLRGPAPLGGIFAGASAVSGMPRESCAMTIIDITRRIGRT